MNRLAMIDTISFADRDPVHVESSDKGETSTEDPFRWCKITIPGESTESS